MGWRRGTRAEAGSSPEHYQKEFAARIIRQIEAGCAPWQKPWKPGESLLPENFSTGKAYQGGNSLYLLAAGELKGYADTRWGTYQQIQAAGGQVRKGEKSVKVLFYTTVDKETGERAGRDDADLERRHTRPVWRRCAVFNVEQADGLKLPERTAGQVPEWEPVERAEAVIRESGVPIRHVNGDRAFYNMAGDHIVLPEKGQFPDRTRYYQTALHELGHATGHSSRLNRPSLHEAVGKGFGSPEDARGELRAEISAMMTGDRAGVGHDPSRRTGENPANG